ncbi:MAG: tRNA (N6-threonylcarbamoyladenosine(37)-N6)-methyltransferase TrmO [Candidatus Syntrophoarchaeum sp.]|nr:tRNA (N6-threonylcarbamoyladenosine(37)-N6)-methyltransferase TrmO [Candidatus Syntrophoarchaeum sp.]
MKLEPIGIIHTPYKTPSECPHQTARSNAICEVEVFDEFEPGLTDIEGFSHLILLYWLHKSDGYQLMVTTPWDTEAHGLFTTRSPRRPNPIGVSVVKLLERAGNILKVEGVDAVDGTPLIDIKPYVPQFDGTNDVKIGWFEGKIRGDLR